MTIFDMLGQSGVMTLLGMGVVFGFLLLLVICVSLVGMVFKSLNHGRIAEPVYSSVQKTENNVSVAAVISAAVNNYKKNN